MKGHLELFEHRLKATGGKLPGVPEGAIDALFSDFEAALGSDEVPYYDVHSGPTLADYYNAQFIRFVKARVARA